MCRARPEEGRIGKKKPSSDKDEEGEGDGEDDIGTQKKTKETRVKRAQPSLGHQDHAGLISLGVRCGWAGSLGCVVCLRGRLPLFSGRDRDKRRTEKGMVGLVGLFLSSLLASLASGVQSRCSIL